MKILILQLARLGDIYQTWPILRALRRTHPHAQIEVLTRPRFAAAYDGLEVISKRRVLPTTEMMTPLLEDQLNVKASLAILSDVLNELKSENYDWILNLSFSPFSSYLTHAIAADKTKVSGYSRTSDGFLAIPDDMSAYFYAQVGIGRPNRFHLAEIFGTLAEVDLIEADWLPARNLQTTLTAPDVLFHVGASEGKKQISPIKWITIINQFSKIHPGTIGLIGSSSEEAVALQIASSVAEGLVTNYVGKTDLQELFGLIAGAKVVVGADSAPMHMASITGTACVNLSLESVNFWETGPRAKGSVILRGIDETEFASDRVANVIRKVIMGEKQDLSTIIVQKGSPSYWMLEPKDADFTWSLVRAIYVSENFPATDQAIFKEAVLKLADINLLMMEQIENIQKGADLRLVAPIIDRGEEIITTIGNLVPLISPLVRWYQTEKIRIGPDSREVLLARSLHIQNLLQRVLDLYLESYGLTRADVHSQNLNSEVKI